MGIRYLQAFITHLVPGGLLPINILNEIIEWKRYHSDCLILIDVMGFVQILTKITLSSNVYGGNYRLVRVQLNSFLKTLVDHGATLLFFCDGPCTAEKSDTVTDRICQRFDQISNSVTENNIIENRQEFIVKMGYISLAVDVCQLYGKIHISYGFDCDLELVKYANENNAMAILAHDSDFLIFDGNWRYWSIQGKQLFSNFETNEFNKSALRKVLGLSQKEMPLLATLAGNDIINVNLILPVFMQYRNKIKKFYAIATFIRRNFMILQKNLRENDIKLIARTIFKDPDDELEELVKQSIKSYDTESACVKYFEESTMYQKYYDDVFMLFLLECSGILVENGFYNLKENNGILLKDILLPVYQRLAGVVLKHKNDSTLEMTVTYFDEDGDLVSDDFLPVYPNFNLPVLDILIKPTESDYINFPDTDRFELLSWIITGDTEQLPDVNLIDKNYIIVNVILNYLVKKKYVSVNEADCILSMVYAINGNKINHEQIKIGEFNQRAITVIAMYEKIFSWVNNSFITLGLTKYLADIEVDGIYFQYLTNIFNNKPEIIEKCINRMGSIRKFYYLCD